MTTTAPIARHVRDKITEQIEQLAKLAARIPTDSLDWRPAPGVMTAAELLGHLLECMAGFCAVLSRLQPQRQAYFDALRAMPVGHRSTPEEVISRSREYLSAIDNGFGLVTDADLVRSIPTVFVPAGESVVTLLLGNLEHLINHKYQLFFYLKLLGVNVAMPDLYRLRGGPAHEVGSDEVSHHP